MKIIPSWKLRREAARTVRQIYGVPMTLASFLFSTRYYDFFMAGKTLRIPGEVPLSGKIAIYLTYPDLGIRPSHLRGLEYLLAKGYTPIVVSNLPLSESEREQLLPLSHLCIERPNFGYDFGGYRDGILAVIANLSKLERLLLINDSTWFALPGCSDWLGQSETLGVDVAAAASNFGIPRVDAADYRSIQWNYDKTHKNFHFCSFALLFSRRVLEVPAFGKFWRELRLSSDKKRTVRRGEIGLTKWAISHGFATGALYDISSLDKDLDKVDDGRLREVAQNLIVQEDPRMRAVKHQVLAGNPDRDELKCLILTCAARLGSSYALADFAINDLGFPFLKKSPVWLSREASDITLSLTAKLPGAHGEEIHAEALQLRKAKARFGTTH